MNTELIGMVTFAPEVKRITFNADQVRALKDALQAADVKIAKLEAVRDAAQAFLDTEEATGFDPETQWKLEDALAAIKEDA
jgi:hypothetical protein